MKFIAFALFCCFCIVTAHSGYAQSDIVTNSPAPLGFSAIPKLKVERSWVYVPENNWYYSHHQSIVHYRDRFFAIWSNGIRDEDAPGQRVMISSSQDFFHWSPAKQLAAPTLYKKDTLNVLTAAGFNVYKDTLIAYFGQYSPHRENTHLSALYTTDGEHWSAPIDLGVPVNPNHGPQPTHTGRLIISGNFVFPFTDDPSGLRGWKLTSFYADSLYSEDNPDSFYRPAIAMGYPPLCEGSFFETKDHALHMLLRATDDGYKGRLWQTNSYDNGAHWAGAVEASFTDNDSKFHFGRLPNGDYYYVGIPDTLHRSQRNPLVLSVSKDGVHFDRHYTIADERYDIKKEGLWKEGEYGYPHTIIYEGYMYVIFSRMKESVEVIRFKLNQLPMDAQVQAKPSDSVQLKWFQDARFGMFIHWDMSSVAGTEISWSRKATKPLDITGDAAGYAEDTAYDNLYKKFNPKKFNADNWVWLAKNAGMKYIVFTAKHHGGFCMWNTKFTNYSITHTAFGRDVVKELSDACHRAGMGFGIYYSPRDWHQPDYGVGDNKKYVDYMNGQLRELLTHYGKVDIIWWDSYGTGDLKTFWRIGDTYELVKSLQPNILMNNRLAILGDYNEQPFPYRGNWDTPEQTLGNFQNSRPWESCMTVVKTPDGGGWSYRPDGTIRSYAECLQALIACATGNGNLLLDVGPDGSGAIPAAQSTRLLQIGEWLKKYAASIYDTRGGPYRNGRWGGSTFSKNKIYLHISRWTNNEIILPPLRSKVIRCITMNNARYIPKLKQDQQGITISLPVDQQDSLDTIIVLELDGEAGNEFIQDVTLSK